MSLNANVPADSQRLPDWVRLGALIAGELPPEYAGGGPIESLSAYEHAYGRPKLVERVMRALRVGDARPGVVHQAFCSIPFETVVTTNVEQLLEAEYRSRHGGILSIIEEQQLRLRNPYDGPLLVKLHGDLHHPSSLVLTERDYDEFSTRRPLFVTWLANQLITRTGLLVGYSLDDPDFRQVVALLRSRLGSSPPDLYVLEVAADPVKVEKYARRGVRVIGLPRNPRSYAVFADLFNEMYQYWSEHFSTALTGATASVRALLKAGRRLDNAVLLLVADQHLSLYDEYVFPTLVRNGLIPLTRQDVTHPSGYAVATLDALLSVSGRVVVETDREDDPTLRRAAASVGRERIVRVMQSGGISSLDETTLQPPSNLDEWESFARHMADMLSARVDYHTPTPIVRSPREEFEQLQQQGHLRAALLIGFVEIEAKLGQSARQDSPRGERKWTAGFKQFLEDARTHLEWPISESMLARLTRARNSLVHGQDDFDDRALIALVGEVRMLLDLIDRNL